MHQTIKGFYVYLLSSFYIGVRSFEKSTGFFFAFSDKMFYIRRTTKKHYIMRISNIIKICCLMAAVASCGKSADVQTDVLLKEPDRILRPEGISSDVVALSVSDAEKLANLYLFDNGWFYGENWTPSKVGNGLYDFTYEKQMLYK